LSGASWGGDRAVMLRLYRSLVRSKLDYGSVTYRSATQAKLRISDPVHHAGIRLATGTFRTSPVSLYAGFGEPSLSGRKKLLLCIYASILAVHIHHPSYSAFISPAFQTTTNGTPLPPDPLGYASCNSFLTSTSLYRPLFPISKCLCRLGSFSRRHLISVWWDMGRAQYLLDCSGGILRKWHPNIPITHIFTDGSVIQGSTGCSFVFDSLFHLHPYCRSLCRPTFICHPTFRDCYFLSVLLSHLHGVLI
jgi:hypothetical protein